MFYQANSYDDLFYGKDFLKRLQKLFPNTVFALKCDDSSNYVLEDGEWLYDDQELPILESLTDNQLKTFMEYGIIYFGNRDC